MITEKAFFEELAHGTPELPGTVYNVVRGKIRRRTLIARTMISLAATLVLALGVITVLGPGNNNVLSPEVASELQTINDFGTGSDISSDLETYALYDGDTMQ